METLVATIGATQSTAVDMMFPSPLGATVHDRYNNPVPGVTVVFTAPASGQSASFDGSATATAVTDSNGLATTPALTANTQTGSYTVTASIPETSATANFNLTNTNTALSSHSVTLLWTPTTTPDVTYNIYRSSVAGGPYTKITSVAVTTGEDDSVAGGQTYYYVVTAVDNSNNESAYSNEIKAVVPSP